MLCFLNFDILGVLIICDKSVDILDSLKSENYIKCANLEILLLTGKQYSLRLLISIV